MLGLVSRANYSPVLIRLHNFCSITFNLCEFYGNEPFEVHSKITKTVNNYERFVVLPKLLIGVR